MQLAVPHPSLRKALERALAVREATHFSREMTCRPAVRERELLDEFIAENDHPPPLNTEG